MSEGKQKDSRIARINLLSNGYIAVQDKDDKIIEDLAGAWTKEKEEHLREVAPEGIEFGSWGVLEHAKEVMRRSEEFKKRKQKKT